LNPVLLGEYNLFNLLRQVSYTAIVALGQLLVVLTGGIDLSVGATMQVVQMLMIEWADTWGIPVLVVLALLIGGGVGLVNGLLVTRARLQPFIATLGTWTILEGIILLRTNGGGTSVDAPADFSALGEGSVGAIPNPVVVAVVLAVAVWVLSTRTRFGRSVFAVGANEVAARYTGLRPDRIKVKAYVLCGMLAAIAGLLVAARAGAFQPKTTASGSTGMELASIAAVVIGGARLAGGKGTVLGTMLGAMVAGLLANVLVLFDVNPYVQQLAIGLIILLAVLLAAGERRKAGAGGQL
jgi:ribose transport system permease protein